MIDGDTHNCWAVFREMGGNRQLRAGWSEPIRNEIGSVIGTMDVYFEQPHEPDDHEVRFVARAAELAGIAMERDCRASQPEATGSSVED